jgi:Kef-type K+ transport system membrane component KefB
MDPLQQLLIIWLGVFVAAFAAQKTRLTPVLYFLAIGALLVNLGVLPEKTDPFIRGFAEIGIIVIMFALGFEESTPNFLKSIKRSWGIALFGAIAPFITAYGVADYFWDDTNISIMCGLAMMATAVSLTIVSLKGEGLNKTPAATGIMTSAVLDDIGALALVAILVPIATGSTSVSVMGIVWIIFKAIGFFGIVTLIGTWLLPHETEGLAARIPFIRKYGIRHLLHINEGEHTTLIVLTLALSVGLVAHGLGFHPAVGAFMAGLVLKEEYFHLMGDVRGKYYEQTKAIIDNVAFSWIGPVFFVNLGTKLIFDWDVFVSVIPQTIILTAGLFLAQVSSAGLVARYTGRFTVGESVMIGFGMLGRAELAFVVLDIAYVQNQILTTPVFYTLMFTSFWLNLAVPVTIAWWKPYYTGTKTLFGKRLDGL